MPKITSTSSKSPTQGKSTTKSTDKSTRSSNRPNPLITKAGITHSGRKAYSNGGKVNY